MSEPTPQPDVDTRRAIHAPTSEDQRSAALDVLRGVAILGILLANIEGFADPGYLHQPRSADGIDALAQHAVVFVVEAKFYVLFSFLFGYGMAIQLGRQRDGTPLPRLARRLLLLFLIGLAHGVLLFSGDILMIYAIAGLPLLFLRGLRPRTAGYLGLGVLGCFAALAGFGMLLAATEPSSSTASAQEAQRALANYLGDPGAVIAQRVADLGTVMAQWWVMIPIVFGYFLLGFAGGKAGVLHRRHLGVRTLRRAAGFGLLLGLPFAAAFTAVAARPGAVARSAEALAYFAAPTLTVAYAAGLLLLGRTAAGATVHAVLAPVGRLALTNYLTQSLVCSLLFTGYGLGLAGRTGQATTIVIALAIYLLQVGFSGWWVRRHAFGPVEWLLRSFTYLRWQPWRRPTGT